MPGSGASAGSATNLLAASDQVLVLGSDRNAGFLPVATDNMRRRSSEDASRSAASHVDTSMVGSDNTQAIVAGLYPKTCPFLSQFSPSATALDGRLYLSHATAQAFLVRSQETMQKQGNSIRKEETDAGLAEQCLKCLLKAEYAELDRIGRRLRTNVGLGGSTEEPDSSFFDYAARHWYVHLSAIQALDDELLALAGRFLRSLQFSYWAEYSYTDTGDFQAIRSAEIRLRSWSKGLSCAAQHLLHLDDYFGTAYRRLNDNYRKLDCENILQWLALMRLEIYFFDIRRISDMGEVRAYVADGLTQLLGRRHQLTLRATSDAVYAPLFRGEIRKARQVYLDIAEDMRTVSPEVEEPNLLFTRLFQGQAEYLMDNSENALETVAFASAGCMRTLGPESNGFPASLRYTQVDATVSQPWQSLETPEHVQQTRERQYGIDDSFAVTTRLFIGGLQGINRDWQGLAHLERGVEFRRQFMPISHLVTLDPTIILATAYRDFEMNYAAEGLVEELETHGMLDDKDRFVRHCQVKHLRALFDAGETDQTIDLLQDLLMQTDREQNNRAFLWARRDLVSMLKCSRRDGDRKAAIALFQRLVCEKQHESCDQTWDDEPNPPRLLAIAESALQLVPARKIHEAETLLEAECLERACEAGLWLNFGMPSADDPDETSREMGNGDCCGIGWATVQCEG